MDNLFQKPRVERTGSLRDNFERLAILDRAIRTARELYADALTMYQLRRWPRAAALGILCVEEVCKIPQIKLISEANTPEKLAKAWDGFWQHRVKARHVFSFTTRAEEVADPQKGQKKNTHGKGVAARDFDQLKQLALYSNRLDDGRWVSPEDIVTEQDAKTVLTLAWGLLEQYKDWPEALPDIQAGVEPHHSEAPRGG